jgi:serine/threonine protein kinase
MGEVYRAKDTKLGREVALKILPATFTNDPERVARFRREAQVLASLNHPHIAQIHGLDEFEGKQFLVLELVDGESLDKRIARGRIPVDEALDIAKQIAEALEAAHEKGIIHRDLKPANIALTRDGSVKVLDFGLAKATEATGSQSDLSVSPTITTRGMMTGVGVILGTAAYMSPEQAKGKAVDKRSDVWAFGDILFEMLTGRPAFAGETLTDIVAAVLKNDPDWFLLPADATFAVRSVLRRCLRKDPAQRLRDIGDARLELDETSSAEATLDLTTHDYRLMFWRAIPWALCVGLTIGVLRLSVSRKSADGNPPVSRVDVTLPESVQHSELFAAEGEAVAISRDGTQLALVLVRGAERQVYHRRMDRPEMTALRGTDNARVVCFSPDGHSIAFVTSDRSIKTLSIADGLVKTVAGNADNGAVAGITTREIDDAW